MREHESSVDPDAGGQEGPFVDAEDIEDIRLATAIAAEERNASPRRSAKKWREVLELAKRVRLP